MMFLKAVTAARVRPIVNTDLIWHIDPTNLDSYPGSGSTIYDLAGSKNGTFVGNTYVDASKHIRLDGASDYISFGTIATTDALSFIGTSYTVGMWWYYVGTGDAYPHAFSMWRGAGSNADGIIHAIERSSRRVFIQHSNVSATYTVTASPNLTVFNTWEYWTFRYDYSANAGKIYKNGIEFASSTGMNTITNTNKTLNLGASVYDTFSDFNGRLGSYHGYNRALTESEIRQNYKATKASYGL